MIYTRLGSTGTKVSRICLGTMTYGSKKWRDWVLEEKESLPFFEHALAQGINFFDTADVYSRGVSEEIVGRAMRTLNVARESVVIATKVAMPMGDGPNDKGLSRKRILASIDASLKRLQMDYVDLYQIHRFDYETPIQETLHTLNDVVQSGKARYIGASSMYAWQFARMRHKQRERGWAPFVTMQGHYNLMYREEEREMNPFCIAEGVGLLPWSPLARGFLTGSRKREARDASPREKSDTYAHDMYYRDEDYDVVDAVVAVAKERGLPPARIALAWLLGRPGVTAPIVGASNISHLDDAVAALELALTDVERARLEQPYRPHPVLGHN
ncbi:MAG: aldo/keto reductase [Gemmatimonadaceae bacterium]